MGLGALLDAIRFKKMPCHQRDLMHFIVTWGKSTISFVPPLFWSVLSEEPLFLERGTQQLPR